MHWLSSQKDQFFPAPLLMKFVGRFVTKFLLAPAKRLSSLSLATPLHVQVSGRAKSPAFTAHVGLTLSKPEAMIRKAAGDW